MSKKVQTPDRNLALELVRVTEAAAVVAARWMGRGDKEGADGGAVNAMRSVLDTVNMDGIVVIGEGEKDEAPMLANGEKCGNGNGPETDIAVDPIDGTYDYINNLEEFTINAGLIINNKPAAGLIYAPAKKRMFYSFGKGNAFELCDGKTINLSEKNIKSRPIKFVSYSNKIKPEIQKIYQEVGVLENIKMKSSLKFCVVAAGDYDGYVAEPRAYEWDIAAGHAILEHSGGTVTDFDGNEILYGKKDLKNPSLILKSRNLING